MSAKYSGNRSLKLEASIKSVVNAIADGRYSAAGYELCHLQEECKREMSCECYLQMESMIGAAMVALEDREVAEE